MSAVRYIAVEGGERSGKTTSIQTITSAIQSATNFDIISFREPHYLRSQILELLEEFSQMLLTYLKTSELSDYIFEINNEIINLFSVERKRRLEETVWPAIWNRTDTVVLSDRSVLSTWVYQYYMLVLAMDDIEQANVAHLRRRQYLQIVYEKLMLFCEPVNIPTKFLFMSGQRFQRQGDTAIIDTSYKLNLLTERSYREAIIKLPFLKGNVILFNPIDLNISRDYYTFKTFSEDLVKRIGIV